jgi:hypothetical protein
MLTSIRHFHRTIVAENFEHKKTLNLPLGKRKTKNRVMRERGRTNVRQAEENRGREWPLQVVPVPDEQQLCR